MAADERPHTDADDGQQLGKSTSRPSMPTEGDGPDGFQLGSGQRSMDRVRQLNDGNTSPDNTKKARSMPDAIDTTAQRGGATSPKSPLPISPIEGSRTVQFPAKSKVRASEEFDRRFDGPFGRPSLTMDRRRSSLTVTSPIGRRSGGPLPVLERDKLEDRSAGSEGESSGRVLQPVFEPEPPPLNYTLRTRKLAILLFWTVIVFDSVAMPIALYFGLWYGVGPGTNTPEDPDKEKLSANTVFSIVTAAIGGASIIEYFLRFWRLWKKNSTCRVIGARRWYLDWFHWNFSLAWIIVMIELIV